MKSKLMVCLVALFMVASLGTSFAVKDPVQNVSGKLHPNLDAAQDFLQKAFDEMEKAQKANEYDLGGHCRNAKALTSQASQDLKKAAKASNKNKSRNPEGDTSNIDTSAVNEKINPDRHPHLASAQNFLAQAYEKMVAAQIKNEYDLDGWAKRAKEKTASASLELGLAAKESNKNAKATKNLEAVLETLKTASTQMADALKSKEYDRNGHANKAEDLINQAQKELEAALGGAPAETPAATPADGGM